MTCTADPEEPEPRIPTDVELLDAGPSMHGLGYVVSVEGPVYQADDVGNMRLIDGADLDPRRPFYFVPDEAAHEQGDEPGELGPEWKEMGMTDYTRQLNGPELIDGRPVGPLTELNDRIVVDVDEVQRIVGAIEVTGRLADDLAERIEGRLVDGVSIADVAAKRPVPVPPRYTFHLPEQLGGLPEDGPDVRLPLPNRAARRAARFGRRSG